jgi:NAD+ diphosphatase
MVIVCLFAATAGETMEEACIREVREEIGIDLDPKSIRYCGSQSWPGPSVLMIGYIAMTADDSQPIEIDKSELESARWFDRSEVVEMLVHKHPDKIFIPPREAIAHQLVKTWVLETGFK